MKNYLFSILFALLPVSAIAEPEWCGGVRETVAELELPINIWTADNARFIGANIADLIGGGCDKDKTIAALVAGHERAILLAEQALKESHNIRLAHGEDFQENLLWAVKIIAKNQWEEETFYTHWQTGNPTEDKAKGEQLLKVMFLLEHLEKLLNQ